MPDPFPSPEPWLRIARIARPQGHRGELLCELLTDFPERFEQEPEVSLRAPGAAEPSRSALIEQHRLHGDRIVLKLAGCDTMTDAEGLRDYELVVPWEARMPLAEDEIYIAELTGCILVDAASGLEVGTVTGVDRESGATDLLVIETRAGTEALVPFVKAFEPAWDLATRVLRMTLPEGLLDLQDSAPEKPQRRNR